MTVPRYPPLIRAADFIDRDDLDFINVTHTGRVARTGRGREHAGRLREPDTYRLLELRLKTPSSATAPAQSKCYLPPGQRSPTDGSDDFHFAPETESIQIFYRIEDPGNLVERGKYEIFRRGDATPLYTQDIWPALHGEHSLAWNGQVRHGCAHLPDDYLTVEHSPYKLKLTLGSNLGTGQPAVAWTYFHVLVADLQLELGPRSVLTLPRDQTAHDSLGGSLPAPGGPVKDVRLVSNIFKTASTEMYDNTAFTEYQTAWSDGARLPVFARVRIRNTAGQAVDAHKALGNVKFLWDWEDVAENTARHHATAVAFLNGALDYDRNRTHPKGDNCHLDRGGKRGPAAPPVFPPQTGQTPAASLMAGVFPFQVVAAATRSWAALSRAWTRGAYAGKTGVIFQPSRMAGDAYKLTVYLAHDKRPDGTLALDVADDAPLPLDPTLQRSTGTFQVRREVHLVKHLKKRAAIGGFNLSIFQDFYEKAFIRLHSSAGAATTMAAADYNTRVAAAVTGLASWYKRVAVDPATDQHAAGDYAIHFRDFSGFKLAAKADRGWTDAQLIAWMGGVGAQWSSEIAYFNSLSDLALELLESVCNGYLHANDGINVFQFAGLFNYESRCSSITNGFAPSLSGAGRHKCAFIQFATASTYAGDSNTMEQTIAHEIGHHLFLPHAPDGVAATGGAAPSAHDQAEHHCLLSYNYTAVRRFCGLCLLRLRGWSGAALANNAAGNRRA